MQQNELKIIAKWYGGIALSLLKNKAWDPDIDGIQLELLKKKFLKEADITRIEYDKTNTGWWQGTYYVGVSEDAMGSEGKEIKDCDLEVIFNYVKEL